MIPPRAWSRRSVLRAAARTSGLAAGWAAARWVLPVRATTQASQSVVEIHMVSDTLGTMVGFDPIGLHVPSGTTVRWVVQANVHTTTAYHPANGQHSLRVPPGAIPWDSGYLVNPGDHFQVTLDAEGVYDYFCLPHEAAGMVGRIVVGRPAGPGSLPFDYFVGRPEASGWIPVPPPAQAAFPSIDDILRLGAVRLKKSAGMSMQH